MVAEIFHFQEQHWHLSPQRAIFWEEEKALILSDLHLGKAAHFRKAGIAVPAGIVQEDLFRLQQLITQFLPERIIIVGDMFHSRENNEVQYFKLWRQQFSRISFDLVKGNHDIMPDAVYEELQINVHPALTLRNIHFIHEPCEDNNGFAYTFSGHLHPAFVMHGAGRQRLRLPCFYFGRHCGILPAFGHFTGSASLDPEERDPVFVIAGKTIIRAQ
ncbi:ligase-associated DNA damage response endonuclease PdeM [Chitinophaga ginsengisegetis]|uniref:ligase-associated DNA damage response endonuclease PdeM n=1 Tax=Chitinophaga ginsengisegetis TaxID=393003 RepID=UPI000DB9CFA7|nr:ligase-associated DNA damage response endonuclease PdeM [Chitinophaga ginsengisegetis]MDR6565228.1 DNA ligase-associated metallophosphoesterase [Chitinophaga ginsengisegetis]MDR6644955.1 DNA ligase-associated metallophosphoesterase [Chitinophaga ginsengisegetis]MDR6652453.1 DNA ligase-associated metallophosphoesterase [Chitinophaga ginsengisegetis]